MKQGNLKIDKNLKLSKFLEKIIIEEEIALCSNSVSYFGRYRGKYKFKNFV